MHALLRRHCDIGFTLSDTVYSGEKLNIWADKMNWKYQAEASSKILAPSADLNV
jgi:hypothetical protein